MHPECGLWTCYRCTRSSSCTAAIVRSLLCTALKAGLLIASMVGSLQSATDCPAKLLLLVKVFIFSIMSNWLYYPAHSDMRQTSVHTYAEGQNPELCSFEKNVLFSSDFNYATFLVAALLACSETNSSFCLFCVTSYCLPPARKSSLEMDI